MQKIDEEIMVQETSGKMANEISSMELVDLSKAIINMSILCNQVCFTSYDQQINPDQTQCHRQCFNNLYSSLMYCQTTFIKENQNKS